MTDPELTYIDLLRHGEIGDTSPRLCGRTDEPLSPRGWKQLRGVIPERPPWQVVISSPRQRCEAFARELERVHGLPVVVEPRFAELDFGDWDGRLVEELIREDHARLERFWQEPQLAPPPGGESLAQFQERVRAGWHEHVARERGRTVLILAHGGTIRVLLSEVLGMPPARLWSIEVPHASLSRIRLYGELPQLLFHNCACPPSFPEPQ